MQQHSEAEIIKGCQREDARFQRELVMRYSGMLMTVARRYARDEGSAEDILQEAYVRIFKNIRKYKPSGTFEGWMRRIVINEALRILDRKYFKCEHAGLEDIPPLSLAPEVYNHLGTEELMKLIRKLPDGFREIFNLAVIEGYSHEEIGDMLNITASTSRSQLTRAKKKLRQMITELERENIDHVPG